jgi:chaperonin GroEL
MAKNIKFSKEAREKIVNGINTLANAVKITLGPRGRNVIIGSENDPIVTNDGVTVARAISLEDEFEMMGAQLIRQVADRTEREAGDGTTTATILTQAIIEEGMAGIKYNKVNPMYLKRGLEKGRDIIVEAIKEMSTDIKSEEQISQIATISANNDEIIGNLIGDAMKEIGIDGLINVEESKTHKTSIDKVDGMEVEKPILSPYFINDEQRMLASFEDPYILIVDDQIHSLKELLPILQISTGNNRPIFIIAEDVIGEALSGLVVNSMKGNLKVAAIKAPGYGDLRRELLSDIAIFTGAKIFSSKYGDGLDKFHEDDLGTAKKILCGETTVIQEGGGSVGYVNEKLDQLREKQKSDIADYEKEKIANRIAKLSTGVAILKVGANTEVEMREKRMRIDDALHATRAAIEEGVVDGGGIALFRCIESLERMECNTEEDRVAKSILEKVLEVPLRQIATNCGEASDIVISEVKESNLGYNAATNEYVNLIENGIIDPTKVVRNTIENAISVASLILTTEVAIGLEQKKDVYSF